MRNSRQSVCRSSAVAHRRCPARTSSGYYPGLLVARIVLEFYSVTSWTITLCNANVLEIAALGLVNAWLHLQFARLTLCNTHPHMRCYYTSNANAALFAVDSLHGRAKGHTFACPSRTPALLRIHHGNHAGEIVRALVQHFVVIDGHAGVAIVAAFLLKLHAELPISCADGIAGRERLNCRTLSLE